MSAGELAFYSHTQVGKKSRHCNEVRPEGIMQKSNYKLNVIFMSKITDGSCEHIMTATDL
jgi:hypothetical protein